MIFWTKKLFWLRMSSLLMAIASVSHITHIFQHTPFSKYSIMGHMMFFTALGMLTCAARLKTFSPWELARVFRESKHPDSDEFRKLLRLKECMEKGESFVVTVEVEHGESTETRKFRSNGKGRVERL